MARATREEAIIEPSSAAAAAAAAALPLRGGGGARSSAPTSASCFLPSAVRRRRRRRRRRRGNVSRDTFQLGPVQARRAAQALGTVRDEPRARAAAPGRAQDQVLRRLRVPGGVRGQRQGGGRAPAAEGGGYQHRERRRPHRAAPGERGGGDGPRRTRSLLTVCARSRPAPFGRVLFPYRRPFLSLSREWDSKMATTSSSCLIEVLFRRVSIRLLTRKVFDERSSSPGST